MKFAEGGVVCRNNTVRGDDVAETIIPNGNPKIEWIDDIVQVVRCKDCKHRYTAASGVIFCTQHITVSAKDDDFCSYGERKKDNG